MVSPSRGDLHAPKNREGFGGPRFHLRGTKMGLGFLHVPEKILWFLLILDVYFIPSQESQNLMEFFGEICDVSVANSFVQSVIKSRWST